MTVFEPLNAARTHKPRPMVTGWRLRRSRSADQLEAAAS